IQAVDVYRINQGRADLRAQALYMETCVLVEHPGIGRQGVQDGTELSKSVCQQRAALHRIEPRYEKYARIGCQGREVGTYLHDDVIVVVVIDDSVCPLCADRDISRLQAGVPVELDDQVWIGTVLFIAAD